LSATLASKAPASSALVNLGGISFINLIGHISLDDSLALWNHWPISFTGIIGFGLIASSASAISLAHWLIGLVSLGLAAALIAAKTIGILLLWLEQKASHCHKPPNHGIGGTIIPPKNGATR
jgi:hypothetical protein